MNFQAISDKTAIALSLFCAIHCLGIPLTLILVPSLASLQLDNEAFHFWMLLAVLPVSVYALTLGCKRHKRIYLLAMGSVGLTLMLFAVFLPISLLGEAGEKILTVLGAALVAIGHFKNYTLCRASATCGCHEQN